MKYNDLSAATRDAVAAQVAAQFEAAKAPYVALAAKVGAGAVVLTQAKEAADGARKGLWSEFKGALSLAMAAEHSPATMRMGLEIACTEAEVPAGSFRSYVGTLANLLTDIQAEALTLAEAEALSIADARKRYKAAPTELEKAKALLLAAIENWSATEVNNLATLAAGKAQEDAEDVALELVSIGQRHAAEKEAKEAKAETKEAAAA